MEHLTSPAVILPLIIIFWFVREFLPHLRPTLQTDKPILPEPEPFGKSDYLTAATIAVSFYLLCLWRLGSPSEMYFDEVHHVRSAMEYIWGQNPHEWSHPPLTKLILAGSMKMFGTNFNPSDAIWSDKTTYDPRAAITWRFPSVCFGTLALVGVYALARSLFNSRMIAAAAMTLLALDGVFFVHSRIGMTNIFTVCFIVYGTLGTYLYIKRGRSRWLLLTGLALSLALCTRWSSLWAWGLNGVLLLWYLFAEQIPRWRNAGERTLIRELLKWVVVVSATMIVLPVLLYVASYIPFVLQGSGDWQTRLLTTGESGIADWSRVFERNHFANGHGWYKALNQQKDMWIYHAEIKDPHPYSSPWWSWPLELRPAWYYFRSQDGTDTGIWSIGNLVIWWASVPALAFCAYLTVRERIKELGLVTLLGLGMWLCWAIKSRPLVFMHYYFEAIPFVCIALAYLGWRIHQTEVPAAQRFVRGTAIAVGAWFFFFYPLLSAQTIPDWYFRIHLWLDQMWI